MVDSQTQHVAPYTPLTFAVISPVNREAKELYSGALQYVKERSDCYHGRFMQEYTVPHGSTPACTTNVPSPSQLAPDSGTRGKPLLTPVRHEGAFQLLFNHPPQVPREGWRFGRGVDHEGVLVRGVDLLACSPTDALGAMLEPIEFILNLHPLSGMLIMSPGHKRSDLALFSNGNWISVGPSHSVKKHALYQRVNRIRIGNELEYEVVYQVKTSDYDRYHLQLDRKHYFLQHLEVTPPWKGSWPMPPRVHSGLLDVPGTGQVITYRTILSGYGYNLIQAIAADSGQPLVLKEVVIGRDDRVREKVQNEIALYTDIKVFPTLFESNIDANLSSGHSRRTHYAQGMD